jgi:hypothetical protein
MYGVLRWPFRVAITFAFLGGCGGIVQTAPNDAGSSTSSSGSGSGPVTSSSSGGGESSSGSGGASGSSGGGLQEAGTGDDATSLDDSGDDSGDAATIGPCGVPPVLQLSPAGEVFCGYDGGAPLLCQTGQQCCLGGSIGTGMYAAEQCASWNAGGAGCTNPPSGGGIGIACNQVADCEANGLEGTLACCLQGSTAPFIPPNCQFFEARAGTAVACEGNGLAGNGVGTCAAGEVQICSSAADCPAGKQCIAGKWKIFQVGFCM